MTTFRIEKDSMGEVQVPAQAYYGAQTQRAVENFPISGWTLPAPLIRALGLVKLACATANRDLGKLTQTGKNKLNDQQVDKLLAACREVAEGKLRRRVSDRRVPDRQRHVEQHERQRGDRQPGDRAAWAATAFTRTSRSTPTTTSTWGRAPTTSFPRRFTSPSPSKSRSELIPALQRLHEVLAQKAKEWDQIIKIGRTHLADATPLRLGQEIGGLARQIELSIERARRAIEPILELPAGGTAVGTGINTHPEFGRRVAAALADETGLAFVEAKDHFEANAQRDGLVECHGQLRTIAMTLFNVSNNIRWLGSGPRCGFYEIKLPDRQPGSSIMPGKVNPVMCESLMQVAARVLGNDQTIAFSGATGGQFQLNIMMPVMGHAALESVAPAGRRHAGPSSISASWRWRPTRRPAKPRSSRAWRWSPASTRTSATSGPPPSPRKPSHSGKTIRELCREQGILPEPTLREALDPDEHDQPQE